MQTFQNLARRLRLALEACVGARIPHRHPVLMWLIEWVGGAHNRFKEGRDDGRTPRDRAGWQRQSLVLEFGEVVNFIPFRAEARSDKFDAKLREGIWLGLDGRTDESLVGTKYGIYRTATIKPSAEDARWSAEKVLAVAGMPWDPTPSVDAEDGARVPNPDAVEAEAIPRDPEVPEAVSRRMYIKKSDILKFGKTEGCIGCRNIMLGKPIQSHTAVCRERIESKLRETDEGQERLSKANDRMSEAIMRETERMLRESSRDDAEAASRQAQPATESSDGHAPSKRMDTRESTAESAPSADDGSRPPPLRTRQRASMGQGGGSAETRQSSRGRKRVVSGELEAEDQREAISRRLPDIPQGVKRPAGDGGDLADQREHVSRRLPDDDAMSHLVGEARSLAPDSEVGAVGAGVKKRSKWDTGEKQFEERVAWDGARRDMAVVRQHLGCQHDVSEFYSPPRVVKMAKALGMRGGVSLDLTVPASDGYVWDFSRKHCRDKAMQIIQDQKPLFLMLSPECMPYSNIQNLNMRTAEGKAKVERARRRGDVHLRFCVSLAEAQMSGGRYFVYEHPKSAASWENPAIVRLMGKTGVMRTELDQCEFGLVSKDEHGEAPAMKPTSLLTNSVEVDRMMHRKCGGGHRHVHLMAGRARAAAHYPAKFCRALCKDMKRQARVDASDLMSTKIFESFGDEVGTVTHVPEKWQRYWDDISGKELVGDLVRAAREEELKVVDEMGVWELRPVSEYIEVTGKRRTKVRWVDVNKGDTESPNVRSRIVAKGFRTDSRPDLFAATPPFGVPSLITSCPGARPHDWGRGRRSSWFRM